MSSDTPTPARRADSPQNWRRRAAPTLFSYGFRPFFLGAGVVGLAAIALWLPMWEGHFALPSAFAPVDWHAHELLFGYLGAAMAGFLLTAIPNWTGRLPVAGRPLALLWSLWIAGRVAVAISGVIGAVAAATIDVAFLLALAALAAREIVAGKNWRNLRVLSLVLFLGAANIVFHVEAATQGRAAYGTRMAIAGAVLLVSLIGGRIVPSFTRNWLARRGQGRLPAPFGRFDGATIAASAAALGLWIILPEARATAAALLIAGLMQALRLARWAGERTGAEPLVWSLHLAYGFAPLGFLLCAVAIVAPDALAPTAALHAWTVGLVGLTTMAVMTRATRGHTGHALAADRATTLLYLLLMLAVAARVAAGVFPAASFALFHVAALAWIGAMALFLYMYAPMLTRARREPR
ncbi:MAG: NnrS family protein [Methylobacteriaceae bacterium]|nr:NnrS family protein [Methylobacteriaceae bacterium]